MYQHNLLGLNWLRLECGALQLLLANHFIHQNLQVSTRTQVKRNRKSSQTAARFLHVTGCVCVCVCVRASASAVHARTCQCPWQESVSSITQRQGGAQGEHLGVREDDLQSLLCRCSVRECPLLSPRPANVSRNPRHALTRSKDFYTMINMCDGRKKHVHVRIHACMQEHT
jgi:hypothetical protein